MSLSFFLFRDGELLPPSLMTWASSLRHRWDRKQGDWLCSPDMLPRHKSTHRHCVSKCFYTHLQLCWMELCPRFEMSKINMVYSVTRKNFKCQQLVCFFVSIFHVWLEKHLSHPACCWAWFVGGSSLGEGRSVPELSKRLPPRWPWEDLRGFPGVCTPWDNCCSVFSCHFFLSIIMWMCVSV